MGFQVALECGNALAQSNVGSSRWMGPQQKKHTERVQFMSKERPAAERRMNHRVDDLLPHWKSME